MGRDTQYKRGSAMELTCGVQETPHSNKNNRFIMDAAFTWRLSIKMPYGVKADSGKADSLEIPVATMQLYEIGMIRSVICAD